MIDEQNFPTVTADMLTPGQTIWHDGILRTVDEVTSFKVNPSHVHVRWTGGGLCLFAKDKRFPVYQPQPGTLAYAQRIAEERGDLADAAIEDGI